jgi:hypothetical protein
MPQLDSLNYLNQLLGLSLYLSIFYYTTLQYILPHSLALFKVNEWFLHKVAAYIFNVEQETRICLTFLKPEWLVFMQYIQKSLTDTRSMFTELAVTEQYLITGIMYELIMEDKNASN